MSSDLLILEDADEDDANEEFDDASGPSRGDRDRLHRTKHHRTMLWMSAAVVILAFALKNSENSRVAFRWLPNYPLPHSCISRSWFGLECAGCGLTRSFIYFAEGDLPASFQVHRVGWLLAIAVLLQFPYRILALKRQQALPLGTTAPRVFGWSLIILLLVNWLDIMLK